MTRVTVFGRADLLLALDRARPVDKEKIVALLGFHCLARASQALRPTELNGSVPETAPPPTPEPPLIQTSPLRPTPFWLAQSYMPRLSAAPRNFPIAAPVWPGAPRRAPLFRVLAPWRELMPRLRGAITTKVPTGDIDVERIVECLSLGRSLDPVPHRTAPRLAPKIQVIIDRSDRLIPFWDDQTLLMRLLRARIPNHRLSFSVIHEGLHEPAPLDGRGPQAAYEPPPAGGVVLVLGDLGCLDHAGNEALELWRRFGRRIAAARCVATALLPCPPVRCPDDLRRRWRVVPWERISPGAAQDSASLRRRTDRLLTCAAPAVRLEPGLLRAIRRALPPGEADAGTESDVWQHAAIASPSPIAATLTKTAGQIFRAAFAQLPPERQKRMLALQASWRHGLAQEIWYEEVANLPATSRENLPDPADVARAQLFFAYLRGTPDGGTGHPEQVYAWLERLQSRATSYAMAEPDFRNAVESAKLRDGSHVPHETFDPIDAAAAHEEQVFDVRQRGGTIAITPFGAGGPGSLLGLLRSCNDLVVFDFAAAELPETAEDFWVDGQAPSWAEAWGRDGFGPWVRFAVPGHDGMPVTQRMRWVPPGSFLMGSPEDEPGRFGDEGPRHRVMLGSGFWLFDTPCTQALWQAVMGVNPSQFRSPMRPVETVSFEEVQAFLARLNGLLPGLDLALPSEAQWEYACRAGTATATYAGPMEVSDDGRVPVLDAIAWYDGNSAVDFDLPGYKQGTRIVAQKAANAFGLFDMLGNVWEWCADHWHGSYEEAPNDGSAWLDGSPAGSASARRVLRGGSWNLNARLLRSAFRFRYEPADRDGLVGFRCARVQSAGADSGAGAAAPRLEKAPGERSAPGATSQPAPPARRVSYRIGTSSPVDLPRRGGVTLLSDRDALRLGLLDASMPKPDWLGAVGRDAYGLFGDWVLPGTELRQRMRWIPPGRFMMGSPTGEPGRWDAEGPLHLVTLASGFWLFDTPCTQALWQAVMGENPSRFVSPSRPVENVSFADVAAFLDRIEALAPGSNLALPSEAQWEYACRAGTATATYAGPLEILGENNAPNLDAIAWYGGNSGVDFDLAEGDDSRDWADRQYEHERAGTRMVGQKAPNGFGLFDMLGNVWEWCDDDWHNNYEGAPDDGSAWIDTTGADLASARRVLRGGSWDHIARTLRSAYRRRNGPTNRVDDVGFRCARVQSDFAVKGERAQRAGAAVARASSKPRERSEQGGGEPLGAAAPKIFSGAPSQAADAASKQRPRRRLPKGSGVAGKPDTPKKR